MSFLSLCQKVARRAGVSGGAATPQSVVNQVGQAALIVDCVADAELFIRQKWDDWKFLKVRDTHEVSSGTREIPKSDFNTNTLSVDHIVEGSVYLETNGSRQPLRYVTWSSMRRRLFSDGDVESSNPCWFSIDPNGALVFDVPTESQSTLHYEVRASIYPLTLDDDQTPIPLAHQNTIMWLALQYYAETEGAVNEYQQWSANYERTLEALESDQLPESRRTTTAIDEMPLQIITE